MIVLKERYDNTKLIHMFDSLVAKGSTPMWVDPYCEFVCHIGNKNYRFVYDPDINTIEVAASGPPARPKVIE